MKTYAYKPAIPNINQLLPMFTQTPDTAWYMQVAYIMFIGLPALYIASLFWRNRNLKRDAEMLQSLLKDEKKK